jgi:hypothetical protein
LKFSFKVRFGRVLGRDKVILILGSGDTTKKKKATQQLAKAKKNDVKVFYLATGDKMNESWLKSSFPGEKQYLAVKAENLRNQETVDWVKRILA